MHALSLAGVEGRVARQHETGTAVAHQEGQTLVPGYLVDVLALEYMGGSAVRGDVDPGRDERWSVEAEVIDATQVGQDLLGFARDAPVVLFRIDQLSMWC